MIWPHSSILVSSPMPQLLPQSCTLAILASLLSFFLSHSKPVPACASIHAIFLAWNIFFWLSTGPTPSLCSGLYLDIYQRGFPSSLRKHMAQINITLQPPCPCPFFALQLILRWLLIYVFVYCLSPSTKMQVPWGRKLFFYPLLYTQYQK